MFSSAYLLGWKRYDPDSSEAGNLKIVPDVGSSYYPSFQRENPSRIFQFTVVDAGRDGEDPSGARNADENLEKFCWTLRDGKKGNHPGKSPTSLFDALKRNAAATRITD